MAANNPLEKPDIVVGLVELEGSDLLTPGARLLQFKSDASHLTVLMEMVDDEDEATFARLTRPGQRFIIRLQPVNKEG